jgi:hypothetical protein
MIASSSKNAISSGQVLSQENITMKFSIRSLAFILAMALSTVVQAEIYESKDSEGKPVFTDTPTAGAEKVVLPQENIADAVEVPPAAKALEAAAPDTPASKEATGHSDVVVVPDSRNERLESELAADRPHEVLEADKRYEVGDNPSAEELERREQAREGTYIDQEGNAVRVEHKGHVGR